MSLYKNYDLKTSRRRTTHTIRSLISRWWQALHGIGESTHHWGIRSIDWQAQFWIRIPNASPKHRDQGSRQITHQNRVVATLKSLHQHPTLYGLHNTILVSHTIVKPELQSTNKFSTPRDKFYINANYIKNICNAEKQYIATQGPIPESIADFWHMVWTNNVGTIVMLCNLCDRGRVYFSMNI